MPNIHTINVNPVCENRSDIAARSRPLYESDVRQRQRGEIYLSKPTGVRLFEWFPSVADSFEFISD
jgi:hypothetical protein